MDKLKQQIEQRLKANVLMDKCTHCEKIFFRDAWCSQDRVIRFTTPYFRGLFSYVESEAGNWKTGDCVMYEVNNAADLFVINCVFSPITHGDINEKLLKACGVSERKSAPVVLKSWDFSQINDNNKLFDVFDDFLANNLPAFEGEIKKKIGTCEPLIFIEGEQENVTSIKYERNPKARAACLAAHGTACAVCGIDFGKEYGPEFEGKIEVHHVVPLNQIGREYVVDPVRDLIPVCPNCHMILHSKPGGGYYLPEEVRTLLAAGENAKE